MATRSGGKAETKRECDETTAMTTIIQRGKDVNWRERNTEGKERREGGNADEIDVDWPTDFGAVWAEDEIGVIFSSDGVDRDAVVIPGFTDVSLAWNGVDVVVIIPSFIVAQSAFMGAVSGCVVLIPVAQHF